MNFIIPFRLRSFSCPKMTGANDNKRDWQKMPGIEMANSKTGFLRKFV